MSSSHASPAAALENVPSQTLPLPAGPILVATDGTTHSDAALVAAQLLAARTGAPLQAVSAVEPIVVPSFGADFAPIAPEVYVPRRAAQREAIHEQLRRLLPASAECPVTVLNGDPAQVLAATAHERRARLLVLGRGRHGLVDRLLMGETVLRVLQLADVPVLAAEAGIAALPRRILIATDFSPYSVYAARVAVALADPDAMLYLAHVALDPEPFRAAFDRVRRELGVEPGRVQTVVLDGSPGLALAEFARGLKVDLVVSGTHGYGFFNRLVLGSVAMQLVRGAPCSVLAVPGSAAVRAATREEVGRGRTRSVPATEWSQALTAFSRRNANRQCTVEIEDPELGAQIQGNVLPLVGAAFDQHGDEVQLMFGAAGLAGRYLTHVIPEISAIEVVADADDRDRALRVASRSGATLVTFLD